MNPAAGDVSIWQVDLGDPLWDGFSSMLAADEHVKADRFRGTQLQNRYRRCRVALRLLLGEITNLHPARLELRYGQFGKPEISGQWQFNVSHSEDQALIAVSSHPVGIDMEFTERPGVDIAALAEIVCHPIEKSTLFSLHEDAQRLMFYRLWTQKEAYCKARGTGLHDALSSLRFEALPAEPIARVLDERDDHDERCGETPMFFVHDVFLQPGYVGCVCVPTAQAKICLSTTRPDNYAGAWT